MAEQPSTPHSVPRTDAPELVDRINWYVACLEAQIKGNVVRGLAEAGAGFDSAMDEVTRLEEQLEAAEKRAEAREVLARKGAEWKQKFEQTIELWKSETDRADGLQEQLQSNAQAYHELNELLDQAIDREKQLEEQYEELKTQSAHWWDVEGELRGTKEQLEAWADCMNYAWTIICNVSEGDWTKQRQEWQDAAAKCRDQYHALLPSNPASEPEAL